MHKCIHWNHADTANCVMHMHASHMCTQCELKFKNLPRAIASCVSRKSAYGTCVKMADSKMMTLNQQEIENKLLQLKPALLELKAQYEQPEAPLVELRDRLKKLLKDNGLMKRMVIHCSVMGTHPENRYGDGVVPADVIALIGKIFGQGFSLLALLDPTCIEMPPPGHANHSRFLQFNIDLTSGSAGMLPSYTEEIKFLTVTCGHTTQGFRCFIGASPCDDPRFTVDGRLSLSKLKEKQPSYAEAVEEGIKYDCMKYQVDDAHPWISKLFQEAGNAGQQIAQGESRLEILLKIAGAALRLKTLYGTTDWERVKREAGRAGASYPGEMEGLVDTVKELSGGLENPVLLNEFKAFCRKLQGGCRVVRGYVLGALATADWGGEAMPLLKNAFMKAMSSTSPKYALGDEQTLFKSTDFQGLSSTKEKLQTLRDAESFLQQVRKICDACQFPIEPKIFLLGILDARVVHFVANKPDPKRGVFASMNDIGYTFCQEVSNVLSRSIDCPFLEPKKSKSEPSGSKQDAECKVFSSSGEWLNPEVTLRNKGFVVDAKVAHVETKIVYTIQSISTSSIVLKDGVGVPVSHALDVFIQGKFQLHKEEEKDLHNMHIYEYISRFPKLESVTSAIQDESL